MTTTPDQDPVLELMRQAGATLGDMLGRYAAASDTYRRAFEDAAHRQLGLAGICDHGDPVTGREAAETELNLGPARYNLQHLVKPAGEQAARDEAAAIVTKVTDSLTRAEAIRDCPHSAYHCAPYTSCPCGWPGADLPHVGDGGSNVGAGEGEPVPAGDAEPPREERRDVLAGRKFPPLAGAVYTVYADDEGEGEPVPADAEPAEQTGEAR